MGFHLGFGLGLGGGRGGGSSAPNPHVFYVSPLGNDTSDGHTHLSAWKTTGKVKAATFEPGDRVYFDSDNGGFDGNIHPQSGVTYDSYGSTRAILTVTADDSSGVDMSNISGPTIRNLVFKGTGATSVTQGVYMEADTGDSSKLVGPTFFNVDISGFGEDGIMMYGIGTSGFDSAYFDMVVSHDNTHNCTGAAAGINVLGDNYGFGPTAPNHTNLTITRSKAYNNTGNQAYTGNWSGSGIVVAQITTALITLCEGYANGANSSSAGGNGAVGIWTYDSKDVVIRYNESHHNSGHSGEDGGGFDLDIGCVACVMEYNYSHDNRGPGYLLAAGSGFTHDGNVVRYNISVNDNPTNTQGAIDIYANSAMTNIAVYGNTVYVADGQAAIRGSAGSGTTGFVANNILYSVSGSPFVYEDVNGSLTTLDFYANDYYATGAVAFHWQGTNYTTIAAWRAASGKETSAGVDTSLSVNPPLVTPGYNTTLGGLDPTNPAKMPGGYALGPSSPLVGKALNLNTKYGTTLPATDFFGTALTDWTVGVCQAA